MIDTSAPTALSQICPLRPSVACACVQAVVRSVLSLGHEIGSHAAQHVALTNLTTLQMQQQIAWAAGNLSATTGSEAVPVSALLAFTRAARSCEVWCAGGQSSTIPQ